MEIVIRFDDKAEVLIEKLIGAIANINSGQLVDMRTNGNHAETWTTNQDGESIPVAPVAPVAPVTPVAPVKEVPVAPVTEEIPVVPVKEEIPVVPVSSPTYTLAEVQLAASTFARSSETAAQQIKDVLKATFGVARISEIAETRLVEFANALISLGAKL